MLASLVLVALVLAAGSTGRLGWSGIGLLVTTSVLWLLVNAPVEGPVLVALSESYGVTGADLAAVAGFGLAAVRAAGLRRIG